MHRDTRPIGWIKAAKKDFGKFPQTARDRINTALTIAAEGRKADITKPLKGLGPGVMEIALRHQTNAYRAVYVTEIAGTLWVVHAFQKKSKTGVKTSKLDVELIRERLRRLRRELLQ
ncbi:MAG: type II toxin-antitoxin system RelE/ParE family toxin [Alphaproteobacteria bacterium]|jgi:phage-related protein|nr:type II toxin-antitoxin system RelE/ParE family toxin [Alphaproteobacteria bacterium]|tara:strand:+ start:124 stop:474 length:351 start_codon:yes stop_codon:yes gene_type:complete